MLMKIDKKNKQVLIMPPCSKSSPKAQASFKEMLVFMEVKFKERGYNAIRGIPIRKNYL